MQDTSDKRFSRRLFLDGGMRSLLASVVVASGCRQSSNAEFGSADLSPLSVSDGTWEINARPGAGTVALEPHECWPSLFGPYRNAYVDKPLGKRLLSSETKFDSWEVSLGTGYASPVVAGDRVFVFHRVGEHEVLQAMDGKTGATLWEVDWATNFKCPHEYSSGPAATPLLVADLVVCQGASGTLVAANAFTGEVAWRRDINDEHRLQTTDFGLGSSPQWIDDKLIVQVGASESLGCLMAMDLTTGETIWKSVDHPPSCSTPVSVKGKERSFVVALTDKGLVSIDSSTGEWLDTYGFRSKLSLQVNATTPLVRESTLWISAYGLGTARVELNETGQFQERWRRRRSLDSQYNNWSLTPVGICGFSARRHDFMCISPEDGELIWQVPSPVGRGNHLWFPDGLMILGEEGRLAWFRWETKGFAAATVEVGSLADLIDMPAPCYSMPAWTHGHLVLRSDTRLMGIRWLS